MMDTRTAWLVLGLCAVCALLLLVVMGLLFGDDDTRPNAGVDIFDPRERGTDDDATEEQLDEGMRLLRATPAREDLTDPIGDDPYEDITYAETYIAPSTTLGARAWREAPTHPGRLLHKHGRPKGDLTLVFEGIAFHEGHEVLEHGPDEDTRVLFVTPPVRGRKIGWLKVVER